MGSLSKKMFAIYITLAICSKYIYTDATPLEVSAANSVTKSMGDEVTSVPQTEISSGNPAISKIADHIIAELKKSGGSNANATLPSQNVIPPNVVAGLMMADQPEEPLKGKRQRVKGEDSRGKLLFENKPGRVLDY